MNVALWVVAGVLAGMFLIAGLAKLAQSKEKFVGSGMDWAADYPPGALKALGAVEVLGAVGLVLPPLLDIAPVLTPVAAVGFAVIMVGALVVHGRRKEGRQVAMNVALLVLAVVLAWGRFGPYAF